MDQFLGVLGVLCALITSWLGWRWLGTRAPEVAVVAEAIPKPVGPFSAEEVAQHCTRDDAWLIIDGLVYDVTEFVEQHPGGDSILNRVGHDSSALFHGDQHPPTVVDAVEEFLIGELKKAQ